jgi:hypothetical protein
LAESRYDADHDRAKNGSDPRGDQEEFLGSIQSLHTAVAHDGLDSAPDIGARHAGNACQRRFQIELADAEYGVGVDARLIAEAEHFFIAGAFAFFDKARADPPDQGMEPEERFDYHVERRGEIIAATDMA